MSLPRLRKDRCLEMILVFNTLEVGLVDAISAA
jgi:hypothetical protein